MIEYPLLAGHCWGITVEVRGQPVRVRVLGDQPPSEATLEALQEIAVAAARMEETRNARE